jgi:hypothetical protein
MAAKKSGKRLKKGREARSDQAVVVAREVAQPFMAGGVDIIGPLPSCFQGAALGPAALLLFLVADP